MPHPACGFGVVRPSLHVMFNSYCSPIWCGLPQESCIRLADLHASPCPAAICAARGALDFHALTCKPCLLPCKLQQQAEAAEDSSREVVWTEGLSAGALAAVAQASPGGTLCTMLLPQMMRSSAGTRR